MATSFNISSKPFDCPIYSLAFVLTLLLILLYQLQDIEQTHDTSFYNQQDIEHPRDTCGGIPDIPQTTSYYNQKVKEHPHDTCGSIPALPQTTSSHNQKVKQIKSGDSISFDHLGPIIVNKVCTLLFFALSC